MNAAGTSRVRFSLVPSAGSAARRVPLAPVSSPAPYATLLAATCGANVLP